MNDRKPIHELLNSGYAIIEVGLELWKLCSLLCSHYHSSVVTARKLLLNLSTSLARQPRALGALRHWKDRGEENPRPTDEWRKTSQTPFRPVEREVENESKRSSPKHYQDLQLVGCGYFMYHGSRPEKVIGVS